MEQIERVTIIGAGIMGFGIAKSIFKHGFSVTLYDSNAEQLQKSCDELKSGARRGMDPEKIHRAESLEEAVTGADLVIEAVVEDQDVKNSLFAELGKMADPDTIFASNTSSLDIQSMAEVSGRPERFLGLHFFNPAFLMRLVEVVKTDSLSIETENLIDLFLQGIKKTGISSKPTPGFIVNRLLIPIMNEAFCILEKSPPEKRIAIANEIDSAICKEQLLLIGIFDLLDLTGLDTTLSVANRIYSGFKKNPRYAPSPLLQKYVTAGYVGRKSRRGVYFYETTENDPDYNPRLNENGEKFFPIENPTFDLLELIAVIVNESFRLLEEGISKSYKDIDFCMESGSRWPLGPFALAKRLGLNTIIKKIDRLYVESGENPRYEPSSLLLNLSADLKEYFNE